MFEVPTLDIYRLSEKNACISLILCCCSLVRQLPGLCFVSTTGSGFYEAYAYIERNPWFSKPHTFCE